ncbi:hypothetical protein ACI2KH_14530 [Roseomonas mucosa]|uniref:hypothetical protein n=1 Tax=Roseomonas mucosa TaxID=207340 RepID=UPI00384DC9AF
MNDYGDALPASANDDVRVDDTESGAASPDEAAIDALLEELTQRVTSAVSISIILRDLRGE